MHLHPRRLKTTGCHGFFDPEHHIVTSAAFVVAEVVIKAEITDLP